MSCTVSMGWTGFQWVILGFHGLYWVSMDCTGFQWVELGSKGKNWVSMDFHGYQWVLLGSTALYWVISDFSGLSMIDVTQMVCHPFLHLLLPFPLPLLQLFHPFVRSSSNRIALLSRSQIGSGSPPPRLCVCVGFATPRTKKKQRNN